MKKFFATLLCAALAAAAALGVSACGKSNGTAVNVYAPDGAPALALAELMYEENSFGEDVSYHIVDAGTLASRVTSQKAEENADLIVMPVNMASKVLGSGSDYKMLGAVTHGNLYILANKDAEKLTAANFAAQIAGKEVGVVNLSEFPGVMFKTLLSDYGVTTAELSGVNAQDVTGTDKNYDYFVVPEPAASNKAGVAANELAVVGSVQELYGEGGYPQAVLMAKASLIADKPQFVSSFMAAMVSAGEWLLKDDVTADMILGAIKKHYPDPDNTTPQFPNLSKAIVTGCAVRFEASKSCKQAVKELLQKFKGVNAGFAAEVGDSFFYIPDEQ